MQHTLLMIYLWGGGVYFFIHVLAGTLFDKNATFTVSWFKEPRKYQTAGWFAAIFMVVFWPIIVPVQIWQNIIKPALPKRI